MESLIKSCISPIDSKPSWLTYEKIILNMTYQKGNPAKFVRKVMAGFDAIDLKPQQGKNLHGYIYECAIGETLVREGLVPLYYQASLTHVEEANFDWFLYHPSTPIAISCKTSLRERWKQAALEAMALKAVFPLAKCYLITRDEQAVVIRNSKNNRMRIDEFVVGCSDKFNALVGQLKKIKFELAKPVSPIKHQRVEMGPESNRIV